MKYYIKDDKTILATEKAYRVLYKSQGYMPKTEVSDNETDSVKTKARKPRGKKSD